MRITVINRHGVVTKIADSTGHFVKVEKAEKS
jgi:hypothetical protein